MSDALNSVEQSTPAEDYLAEEVLLTQIDMLRVSAGVTASVVQSLSALELVLLATLVTVQTGRGRQDSRVSAAIASSKAEISKTINKIVHDKTVSPAVKTVLETVAKKATKTIEKVSGTKATKPEVLKEPLIQGTPSSNWFSRQADETAFKYSGIVRQGAASGTSLSVLRSQVQDLMAVTNRNAEALVRTSLLAASNQAHEDVYQANTDVIQGRKQVSTLDSRTSLTCAAYSGASWDMNNQPLKGSPPFNGGTPRHWNCRSVLVPLLKEGIGTGFESPTRASNTGPVSGNITFSVWLDGKSTGFQDSLLGKGRAKLWRDGKISLSQLLDLKGYPMTLEDLRAKYE